MSFCLWYIAGSYRNLFTLENDKESKQNTSVSGREGMPLSLPMAIPIL